MRSGDLLSNSFNINSWVKSSIGSTSRASSACMDTYTQTIESFNPKSFIIPGWQGGALLSKWALKLKRVLGLVIKDVLAQCENAHFNKSLKLKVYKDFLDYAHENNLVDLKLDNYVEFFNALNTEDHPHKSELDNFKQVFATRVATLYLLKQRFLIKLASLHQDEVTETYLRNPQSFFARYFTTGGSTELNCDSFHSNHYSWYCPRVKFLEKDLNICEIYNKISLTEIYKVFTLDKLFKNEDSHFSHTLSHETFGSFLINLMTQFPRWSNGGEKQKKCLSNLFSPGQGAVLYTQFSGDNLESLSLSHWLAQSKISLKEKKYIICPEFKNANGGEKDFLRLSFELQFLSLLVELAIRSEKDAVKLICSTFKARDLSSIVPATGQQMLFAGTLLKATQSNFDRIVLNLNKFPKNNPHHYLINQIQEHKAQLKDNGYIIVMSTKKLFIPSLTDKVEELLRSFKLEAVFTLDQLKGKGEIAHYFYILSKRSNLEVKKLSLPSQLLVSSIGNNENNLHKHSCLSFRVSGVLSNFRKFEFITKGFKDFFQTKNHESTSVYQTELPGNFTFEYYQDAMVDGRLVNTTSRDTTKITHPKFFKGLMGSCLPINQFFQIECLNDEKAYNYHPYSPSLLGIDLPIEEQYRYILVVDYRNKKNPKIDFIAPESYKAKKEDCGEALCCYFGLTPKVDSININLFRFFFQTELGRQVISLSLNGPLTKIKSKTASLLVPKFFMNTKFLPSHLEEPLWSLKKSANDIIKTDPKELAETFKLIEQTCYGLAEKYPWYLSGILLQFNQQITEAFHSTVRYENIFENPQVIRELMSYECHPVYPSNSDVFVKFHAKTTKELTSVLVETKISVEKVSGKKLKAIELYGESGLIATCYSEEIVSQFLEYILQKAIGAPIIHILQNIRVPESKSLEPLIHRQKELKETLKKTQAQLHLMLKQTINRQLYSSPLH